MEVVVAQTGAAAVESEEQRARLAEALRLLARVAFGAVIVVSPFRARIVLQERPAAPIYGDYTDLLIFAGDALVVATLALWGLSLLAQRREVWRGPALIRWPVVGLLAAVWLSVPLSVDPALSVYAALRLTAVVALALYVANEIESIGQVMPAVAAMVGVQALIGVAQVVGQESLGLRALGEYALDPNVPGVSIIWTEGEPKLLRAYGLTDHPNILGGLLGVGLLVMATGFASSRRVVLSLLLAVFVLGAVALLLTFSRSAVLGFGAGLALVFALFAYRRDWPRARMWLGACLAALLLVGAFALSYSPYLLSRANPGASLEGSTEARSLSERDALAKNANEIFISRPITGVGAGALPLAMREEFPDFGYHYQPAHFALLDVAAETGLLGALFYGTLLVVPWVLLWLRRLRLTPELIGLSGALLAVYTLGLFDYYT